MMKAANVCVYCTLIWWCILSWTNVVVPSGDFGVVSAVEVVATHEWTLLGENDTVAAGMHVRMDLSTGQKWVKLITDDDDADGAANPPSDLPATQMAHLQADGGLILVSNDDQDATPHPDGYDFDMMYRTLSQLPDEEKMRIQLPDHVPDRRLVEERVAFEQQLIRIWQQRQELLRQFQEEFVADLPKLLLQRIQSIRDYVTFNPYSDPDVATPSSSDRQHDDVNVDGDHRPTSGNPNGSLSTLQDDLVYALQDLEYQLTDIDMTRDFHTLQGWPLLASLLSDSVHPTPPLPHQSRASTPANYTPTTPHSQETESPPMDATSTTTTMSMTEWREKVDTIQALAAWTMGTALKNIGEFRPYAIEEVPLGSWSPQHAPPSPPVKTTPVDLLAQQLALIITRQDQLRGPMSKEASHEERARLQQKTLKLLYGLGGLLRANRPAQVVFCAAQGPDILAKLLAASLLQDRTQEAADLNGSATQYRKIIKRLLELAADIVMDVQVHASESEQVDEAVARAWASPDWCGLTLQALLPHHSTVVQEDPQAWSSVAEPALSTLHALAPFCPWAIDDDDDARVRSSSSISTAEAMNSLLSFQKLWESQSEAMDAELYQLGLGRIQEVQHILMVLDMVPPPSE